MINKRIFAVLTVTAMAAGGLFAQQLLRSNNRGAPARGPAAPASGGTAEVAALKGQDGDKVSDINFRDAALEIVFEAYSQLVGRTVLKDPAVQSVTITIQSAPGQKLTKEEQIFVIEEALEMNGVHVEDYGEKFVRALPRDKVRNEGIPLILDEEAELPEDNKVVSMFITFKNIPVDEAKTALEGLKSAKGLLLVYERIGKILVTDTRMNINRMREVAHQIDVGTPVNENVFVRQIKNASALEIKTALEQIVQESQKALENAGNAAKNVQMNNRFGQFNHFNRNRPGTLLHRPGPQQNQPAQPTSLESRVTNMSDADRGMIRGKVLIMADERSNKLVVVTAKTNMDFFDKVIKELDVETTPDTVVKVYRLKYAESEDVSDMINELIGNASSSSSGKDNQNRAARSGTSGNLSRSTTTPQRNTATAANRAGSGGDAKAGELTKDNTVVLADKRINGLVVMTQKELVPTVEKIIDSMDIKLSQVLIETVIIEVTLGDDLRTGVDWVQRGRQKGVVGYEKQSVRVPYIKDSTTGEIGYTWEMQDVPVYGIVRDGLVNNGNYMLGGGGGTGGDKLLGMVSSVVSNSANLAWGGANPIGSGVNYLLKSDKLNLAAVIEASKTDSRTKYLASPVVMTVDNKEATINATKMNYLLKGFTSSGNSYSTIAVPDYEQKELGIEIKVTPKINPNGTVMLKVEEKYSQLGNDQEIKYATGNSQSGGSGVLQSVMVPTTVTREMTADVLLENMETVVFGGLTETVVSESETGIPILKDIPWIGKWLFGSVKKNETRNELLVFMTPYVLDDGEAAQLEALRRKKTLSDSRPWEDRGWSASVLSDGISKKEQLRRLKDEWAKQDEERKTRIAIEQEKLKRAKQLEKLSDEERAVWLKMHKEELDEERQKELEDKMLDKKGQEELRNLAQELRQKKLKEAESDIRKSEADEKKASREIESKPTLDKASEEKAK